MGTWGQHSWVFSLPGWSQMEEKSGSSLGKSWEKEKIRKMGIGSRVEWFGIPGTYSLFLGDLGFRNYLWE